MAMKCSKCNGIIPDTLFGIDRNDCKNHTKINPSFDYFRYKNKEKLC